jgi:hypothetical protein
MSRFEFQEIGPDEAAVLLEHNSSNRSISANHVARLAGAMQRGEWQFNGDSIKLNGTGRLLDGQHRLLAVIKSGTRHSFLVVEGLSAETQETVDVGRNRTFSDMLALRGEQNTNALATVCRAMWAFERTGVPSLRGGEQTPTPQQLFDVLSRHPEIRVSVREAPRNCPGLTRGQASVLHYLFSRVDQEDADVFLKQLATGDGIGSGSPVYALRERLLRDALPGSRAATPLQAIVKLAFAIRAFNGWRGGDTVTKFQWKPGGARPDRFPQVDGLDWEQFGGTRA